MTYEDLPAGVREAFEERCITEEQAVNMTTWEMLEHYLEWNGICGWTASILNAVRTYDKLIAERTD